MRRPSRLGELLGYGDHRGSYIFDWSHEVSQEMDIKEAVRILVRDTCMIFVQMLSKGHDRVTYSTMGVHVLQCAAFGKRL